MTTPAPHLIAHLVRSRPAFDIAHRVCPGSPPCQPLCGLFDGESCVAQDEDWWIIPTSGHRAYPYWFTELDDLYLFHGPDVDVEHILSIVPPPPLADSTVPAPLHLPTLLNLIPPLRITRR